MDSIVPGFEYLPDILEQPLQIGQDFFPQAGMRARKALSLLMEKKLNRSSQQDIWNSSFLAKGSPVEFTFKSNQQGIQYTIDLSGSEIHRNNALREVLDILSLLTSYKLPPDYLLFFETIQRKGTLTYGCWLGGRHDLEEDEYKLYIEVPSGADEMVIEWLAHNTRIDFDQLPFQQNQKIKVEIIGYSLKSQSIECYFSIFDLAPWDICKILKPVGLEERQDFLLDLLQTAYFRAIYRELPTKEMGFSYSFAPSTKDYIFSLYTYASALLGNDKQARKTILSLARQNDWDMDYYQKFTHPFADSHEETYDHGLFGIAVDSHDHAAIYTGLSPAFYLHASGDYHD